MTAPRPPDWPWDQEPHAAAITVRSILEGDPILFVSHDADDHGWQFLDGRPPEVTEGRAIGMMHALQLDPGLRALADLPPGWIARRADAASPWIREPNPDAHDEDEETPPRREPGSVLGRLRRRLGGR